MDRRSAIVASVSVFFGSAWAQQSRRLARIGFIANDRTIPATAAGQAFLDGLREKGFVEGKNIVIDRRFAEGRKDQATKVAAEIVGLEPDVIVVSSTVNAIAVKRVTAKIPIVFVNVFDPVNAGLVSSLASPGGNVTGLVNQVSAELGPKRLELLRDSLPRVTQVSVLANFEIPISRLEWEAMTRAASSLGLTLNLVQVRDGTELPDAFRQISLQRPDAVAMTQNAALLANRAAMVALAAEHRLPAMYAYPDIARDGGLMGYGASRPDLFRRTAYYVAAILSGKKPADLPVEQPTKFEFVVNVKTAKALGLNFSKEFLLLRADEVIE